MREQTADTYQGRGRWIVFLLVVSSTHFILQGAPFKLPGVCAFTPRQSSGSSKSSTLLPNNFHTPGTAASSGFNLLRPGVRGRRSWTSKVSGDFEVIAQNKNSMASLPDMQRMGYSMVPIAIGAAIGDGACSIKQLTLVILYSKEQGCILLGMKKRGFGAGKFNGFGGKVEPRETILEGALREFEEECGAKLAPDALKRRAILTFVFQGNPKVMQVHLFTGRVEDIAGEPTETEEMKPQYFALEGVPFDRMWPDDAYWFPYMLKECDFEASFLFAADEKTVLEHYLSEVPGPAEPTERLTAEDIFQLPDLLPFVAADVAIWREAAMKADAGVGIEGPRLLLVPYCPEHVKPYHLWMLDPLLRRLTGSELLSLEEEIEMQKKWATEYDKATFVVLHKESKQMVGDVNLFFYEDEQYHAEINVMVPDPSFRRQGFGQEAVRLMMHYGYRRLGAREFAAKIDADNQASISMFTKLGFTETSFSSAFKQYCLQWTPSPEETQSKLLDSSRTFAYQSTTENASETTSATAATQLS